MRRIQTNGLGERTNFGTLCVLKTQSLIKPLPPFLGHSMVKRSFCFSTKVRGRKIKSDKRVRRQRLGPDRCFFSFVSLLVAPLRPPTRLRQLPEVRLVQSATPFPSSAFSSVMLHFPRYPFASVICRWRVRFRTVEKLISM